MIKIYGYSDDTVEVEGFLGKEPKEENKVDMTIAAFEEAASVLVSTEDGACLVTMLYNDLGVWSATISQLDEDKPLPSVHLSNSGYSVVVSVYGENIKVERA